MVKCDKKTLDTNAKETLKLIENLYNGDTNTDIKYETFNEERNKNITAIMDCHDTIMKQIEKDIANKPEGHTDTESNYNDIKTFETLISGQLTSDQEIYRNIEGNKTQLTTEKSKLMQQLYDINAEISSYTKQTDKINADINNNTGSIESNDGKITIMYYGNYIVLGFVILSLVYINFKYLFIKKVNMLTKEKTKTLFSLKNDKKQLETINNETRMKNQEQLLTT